MAVCHKPTLRCLSHSNHVARQVTSFSNATFVARHRCFVARYMCFVTIKIKIKIKIKKTIYCSSNSDKFLGTQGMLIYLLTGYPVRTEKY